MTLLDAASASNTATTIVVSTLTNNIDAGFNECSGLDMTLDVEEYMEGGVNDRVHKFPSRMQWAKLSLKKGVMVDKALWKWLYGFAEGKVVRKDGLISLLDAEGAPHTVWIFRRGLPVRYAGPSLNAQQNQIAVETIEIDHEGLELVSGASGLAQAVQAVQGAAEDVAGLF